LLGKLKWGAMKVKEKKAKTERKEREEKRGVKPPP